MNRVTKEIDYPIMGMTISLHSALNYNVIFRKETKLTLGIFIVLMVRTFSSAMLSYKKPVLFLLKNENASSG